ncbi:GNAT family N-acetyltransferase [Fictibacillus sp. KIGAM418]|uniref:GNAT family N-acetyltransferase n=1 Tax=Fictibacillus marinisediminis TaxID=2878389 RepID=A0A9X2BCI3_9BACL|nr:GNAT family N-acetyltransferase [Fictibacillus marinisediminis]MCK6256481.1 GNAT family N-acetyltransferase [Fictibacillus marinisediminis]
MAEKQTQKRIRLRELRITDWKDVHAYASQEITCRFQPWGPNAEEDTLEFMGQVIKDTKHNPRSRYAFAIIEEKDEKLIGVAELNIRDFTNKIGEIGYVIHPDYWGRGYATEAGGLLLHLGYTVLRLHRIYATCHPDNEGSARVLEKLGMIKEGVLREDLKIGSGWRNSLLFSILEHEWTGMP